MRNADDYLKELQDFDNAQGKARLRSLVLSFHSTLQRLPALKQELEVMLQSTEALDYEALLKRVEPVLQQASDWLFDFDRLPSELIERADMQKLINDIFNSLNLANATKWLNQFYELLQEIKPQIEQEKQLRKQQAEAQKLYQEISSYLDEKSNDYATKERIISTLEKSANLGHDESAFELYLCYINGNIVEERNIEKALYWLTKSANQGGKHAQYELGVHYADGVESSKNIEKAVYWLEKSANQKYAEQIQYELGERYATGKGVPQNTEKAIYWMEKAATSHWLYQMYLGERYADGEDIPHDSEKAIYWMEKAANNTKDNSIWKYTPKSRYLSVTFPDNQLLYCSYGLGIRYAFGNGIPKNAEKTAYWLEKAANWFDEAISQEKTVDKKNMLKIQGNLGKRYKDGWGVPHNSERAVYWLEKVANHQDIYYQFELGKSYATGHGIPQNQEKAIYWLETAANNTNTDSVEMFLDCNDMAIRLSNFYADGYGVIPQDYEKAIYWAERSGEKTEVIWLRLRKLIKRVRDKF